jgi:sugar/nucleoside kinase (ribokinase family)
MKKFDVVVSGYTCVDMIPDFKRTKSHTDLSNLLIPGKLTEIDGINFVLGGVVPNTGLAINKFSKKVFLNGLVGDDVIGKIAISWFDKFNLAEGVRTTDKAGTAFSIVIAPPGTDRIFLESPGCNQIFDSGYINFEAIADSRLFHFGYPPLLKQFYQNNGEQLFDLLSKVQKMGVVTSLDFSLPDPESESGSINWPEVMGKILPYTDIFAPSLEEALQIINPGKYTEVLSSAANAGVVDGLILNAIRETGRQFIKSGVKILLIKAGHLGAYLLTSDISSLNDRADTKLDIKKWNHCEIWCNAFKADPEKIKNTSGAGDTAVAAFLSAILQGEDPDTSVRYAAMAGRDSLYCKSIHDDLGDWDEMTEEIRSEENELIWY